MSDGIVLDRDDLRRALVRIAHEIVESNQDRERVALVGIHSRGALMARRLRALIEELTGAPVPLGEVDITFYRDDVGSRPIGDQPVVHSSHIDFPLEGTTVVLVDDVLYTGRTVRAAIEALFDYGRPDRVQLAVLVDRGHRELPIRPDYVGKNLPTSRDQRVNVRLEETDDVDEVEIRESPTNGGRMKHLLSIADLSRGDIERIMAVAESFARGRGARHQEGADAARPHGREPLLRVEHAHELLLRAGRQAPVGGRRQRALERLGDRQGRVAARHDRDAVGLRPGRDRDPGAVGRRGRRSSPASTSASVVNAGDGKHEHPSQALLDVYTLRRRLGSLDGADDLDRRRRPAQPRRALQHPCLHAHGRAGHGLRARRP